MTEVIVEDIFKRSNVEFLILMMFELYLTNKSVNVVGVQSSIFIALSDVYLSMSITEWCETN